MMSIPKIKGFRSRVINLLIDALGEVQGQLERLKRRDYVVFEDQQFRVDRVDGTTVKVHGGSWTRKIRDYDDEAVILQKLLTCDSGESSDFEDFKTISGITESCWIYVYGDREDQFNNIQVTRTSGTSLPTVASVYRLLASITCSDGVITPQGIVQWHIGPISDDVCKAAETAPLDVSTTAAVLGTSQNFAREDHVHYVDESALDVGHADSADTATTANGLAIDGETGLSTLQHDQLLPGADPATWADNDEHDPRYWRQGDPTEDKDFETTGNVAAGTLNAGNGISGTYAVLDPATGDQVLLSFTGGILTGAV